ncbi:MAG: GntR family transcriptional regulator [Eubacteriales bacterium]|nr:GntR family transcriptional regulator [Eubacteriales bacterium]
MEWTYNEDLPIYSQIAERIKVMIVSGQLKPGERLKSVRDLAMEAGVNPNTMQRAMGELEREGLVLTERNSGRFVTEDEEFILMAKKKLAEEEIKSFLKVIAELGITPKEAAEMITKLEGKQDGTV